MSWHELAVHLPGRRIDAIAERCTELGCGSHSAWWSKEELKALRKATVNAGSIKVDWVVVASSVGRTPDQCRRMWSKLKKVWSTWR